MVTNDLVAPLHLQTVVDALLKQNSVSGGAGGAGAASGAASGGGVSGGGPVAAALTVETCVLPDGEEHKTMVKRERGWELARDEYSNNDNNNNNKLTF